MDAKYDNPARECRGVATQTTLPDKIFTQSFSSRSLNFYAFNLNDNENATDDTNYIWQIIKVDPVLNTFALFPTVEISGHGIISFNLPPLPPQKYMMKGR